MDKQPVAVSAVASDDESGAKRTTSVYLPVVLLNELDEAATGLDRPRTWVIQRAVEEWLERRQNQIQQQV